MTNTAVTPDTVLAVLDAPMGTSTVALKLGVSQSPQSRSMAQVNSTLHDLLADGRVARTSDGYRYIWSRP